MNERARVQARAQANFLRCVRFRGRSCCFQDRVFFEVDAGRYMPLFSKLKLSPLLSARVGFSLGARRRAKTQQDLIQVSATKAKLIRKTRAEIQIHARGKSEREKRARRHPRQTCTRLHTHEYNPSARGKLRDTRQTDVHTNGKAKSQAPLVFERGKAAVGGSQYTTYPRGRSRRVWATHPLFSGC